VVCRSQAGNDDLYWLAMSLPPRDNCRIGEKLLGVVEAYLDESGIDERDPVCLVCGYVGGYAQFRLLQENWKAVVSCLPGNDFHAKRFFTRDQNGERLDHYRGWSDKKAREFVDRLIEAIHSTKIHPVGAAADVRKFFEYDLDRRVWLTGGVMNSAKWKTSGSPHSPYYVPFQHCVLAAKDLVRGNLKVNIFCDQNHLLFPYAFEITKQLKRLYPDCEKKLGTTVPVSRTDVVMVQAADLLTHIHYRHKANPTDETEYALSRLLEKENNIRYYGDKGLEMALETYVAPGKLMAQMNPQAARRDEKRKQRAPRKDKQ
jgi:hypothetical protein